MLIFINELSLARSFPNSDAVRDQFSKLMKARAASPALSRVLRTSHVILDIEIIEGETVRSALNGFHRDSRNQILNWLSKNGPFLENERELVEDDLFYFERDDVTNLGLGEASRRILVGQDAIVFSFAGSMGRDFRRNPLVTIQGFIDEPIREIDVRNIWSEQEALENAEQFGPEPESWPALLEVCRARYTKLVIGDVEQILAPHPFHPGVARSVRELLSVLDEIMRNVGADLSLNARGVELYQQYFVQADWFSDESDGNKVRFKNKMTFEDPLNVARKITCFWHGKINEPAFRIHFEWPLTSPAHMRVPYIGPKISKT